MENEAVKIKYCLVDEEIGAENSVDISEGQLPAADRTERYVSRNTECLTRDDNIKYLMLSIMKHQVLSINLILDVS